MSINLLKRLHGAAKVVAKAMKPSKPKMTWPSTPPPGETGIAHNLSVIEIVEDASTVLRTDPSQENDYIIVGWEARAIFENLPHFQACINENGLRSKVAEGVFLGVLGQRKVFLDMNDKFTGFEVHNKSAYVPVEITA